MSHQIGKQIISGAVFTILAIMVARMVTQASIPTMYDLEASQSHFDGLIATTGIQGEEDTKIGQTFSISHHNLNSITIWLTGDGPATAEKPFLHFTLYTDLQKKSVLYRATYQLPTTDFSGPFRISFPKTRPIEQEQLFFELSASSGGIQIKGSPEDIYPNGSAFINDNPIPADLAFSTTYQFDQQELFQDLRDFFYKLYLLLPLFLVLVLPGWILIQLLELTDHLGFWGTIALSGGLSLAVIPIIYLWSNMVSIRWNGQICLLFVSTLIFLGTWIFSHKKFSIRGKKANISRQDIYLTGIVVLSGALRLLMVRDYAGPLWVDSVQHGLVTRLMQIQGGIFVNYSSYFDIPTTTYHPGFHASLAVFQWISGLRLPFAMLWFGQVLNTLAVVSTFLFSKSLFRSTTVGLWAALAAGLLTPLPAYLTSWGRYTHLAGMIVFASGAYLFSRLLKQLRTSASKRNDLHNKIPRDKAIHIAFGLSICIAGLFLIHYRVIAFFFVWCLVIGLSQFKQIKDRRLLTADILVILMGTLLAGGPWIVQSLQQTIVPRISSSTSPPPFLADFDLSILTSGYGEIVLVIAAVGLLFYLFRKPFQALAVLAWVAILFLLANLGSLGVPGGLLVNHISVEITLFPLIAFLFGYGITQTYRLIEGILVSPWKRIWRPAVIVSGIVLSLCGASKLISILNPNTALLRNADLDAINWISKNLSPGQRFLISSFVWGTGLCAGDDGGYFISAFSPNDTYPQTILYGFSTPEVKKENISYCQQAAVYTTSSQKLWDFMEQRQLVYVYLGARGGMIVPSLIQNESLFELIYQQNGVWIAKRLAQN